MFSSVGCLLLSNQDFKHFGGLVRPEAMVNQHRRFPVSKFLGLGVKDMLEQLKADLGVSTSRFRVGILPSGGGERCPVTSMISIWPDNHRALKLAVYLDGSDRRWLSTCAYSLPLRLYLQGL